MSLLTPLQTLSGHDERAWCVRWNPKGTLLASCGGDKKIVLWGEEGEANEDGKPRRWVLKVQLTEGHSRTVRSVAWSPSGTYLASCSFDRTICIWKRGMHVFEAIATLEGHENEVKSVAWSASGQYLASCSRDKTVWIWSCEYDDEYDCLSVLGSHTQDVKKVAWSPVEDVLASCSYDNTIKMFRDDGEDWTCMDTLNGHQSTVWAISFDASGKRLVSVSDDCTLKIWHFLSPIALGEGDSLTIAQSSKWHCVCTITGMHRRTIFDVDWNHIHGCIATASADDGLRIFREDLKVPDPLREPSFILATSVDQAHDQDVNAVAWHPTRGNLLATCGDDGLIKLWSFTLNTHKG